MTAGHSSTNLWLEITAFTNNTAALVIHRPLNDTNVAYDLYYTTNVSMPRPWYYLMRCISNINNVLVTNLCDQQGFYELVRTNGVLTVIPPVPPLFTNSTPLQLARLLVPPWVTVTNATFKGAYVARGTFAGGIGCGLPIDSGVILSTGHITNAIGPNNDSGWTARTNGSSDLSSFNTSFDTNLNALIGNEWGQDATVLEFDIISSNSFVLQFQYVFASEEYPSVKEGVYMKKTILVLVWAVGMSLPRVAPAQGTLYLSNLGSTSDGSAAIGSDAWIAQVFYTGNNPDGYALNSIQLLMNQASGSPSGIAVSIYSIVGVSPGSSLGSLSGYDPAAGGVFDYTASDITLSPSTGYCIVLTGATSAAQGSYFWSFSGFTSPNTISPSDPWELRNVYYSSTDGLNWTGHGHGEGLGYSQVAVYATPVPEPSVDWLILIGGGGICFYRRISKRAFH